jgi:hypothetical protein
MRASSLRILGLTATMSAVAFGACAHEEKVQVAMPALPLATDAGLPEPPPPPPQYVLAEPMGKNQSQSSFLALGKGEGIGAIVEGLRVISSPWALRAAKEIADPMLVAVERVPPWLGGGFVFWGNKALFHSDAFDGVLTPIATLPTSIHAVSFGPKSMLVRCDNGERWAFELPSGKRAALEPQGVADVAALRDGRAIAFTDTGAVMVSSDSGARWTDVTGQLRGKPEKVFVHEEALWLTDTTGRAVRLEPGGRLSSFDKAPTVKPQELRPRDPRWHSDESPVRKALRLGAPMDETTALVASDGDIVRVNVATGEIIAVSTGKLPPDASCEGVRTNDDVLMVCVPKSGTPFVASHVLGDKAPVLETFPQAGQFFASDDGSLAFAGPCQRAKVSRSVVCVRTQGGVWQELDLDNVGDAGTLEVSRWVPRSDGTAIGFVVGANPGLVDARTGDVHPWTLDALPPQVKSSLVQGAVHPTPSRYYGKMGYYPGASSDGHIVDRGWSWTGAGLRGWLDNGVSVEVQSDGTVVQSPFTFDRVAHSGAFALARQKDGRVWQSTDRGAHWTEVAAPFLTRASGQTYSNDPRSCSAMGCDLGSWYRLGWVATAPTPLQPPAVVTPPPLVNREALPQLQCRAAGELKVAGIARGENSPDDLGLGTSRVPVANDARTIEVTRVSHGRAALNPPHGSDGGSDGEYASLRAVSWQYNVEPLGDSYTVLGPSKDLGSFRRNLQFLLPFDPSGAVRRASFGAYDVIGGGRHLGLHVTDVFRDELHNITGVLPAMAADGASPDDVLFFGGGGDKAVLVLARANGKMRVVARARSSEEPTPVSAAIVGADDLAVLEVDGSGAGHVFRIGAAGVAPIDLFDLPAPPSSEYYPANADAIAIGPKGEIAVLRTPSGSEPPSAKDPALLIAQGGQTTPLAPWSTIEPADSPACKADTGWRATINAIGPWLRFAGNEPKTSEEGIMVARVRWSTSRVCLEAVELRLVEHEQRVNVPSNGKPRSDYDSFTYEASFEPWLVARFLGAPVAGKVAVMSGAELHQAMQCSLVR